MMVEVLIEDLSYDELKKPVKKPLEGTKIAGLRRLPDQPPLRRGRQHRTGDRAGRDCGKEVSTLEVL